MTAPSPPRCGFPGCRDPRLEPGNPVHWYDIDGRGEGHPELVGLHRPIFTSPPRCGFPGCPEPQDPDAERHTVHNGRHGLRFCHPFTPPPSEEASRSSAGESAGIGVGEDALHQPTDETVRTHTRGTGMGSSRIPASNPAEDPPSEPCGACPEYEIEGKMVRIAWTSDRAHHALLQREREGRLKAEGERDEAIAIVQGLRRDHGEDCERGHMKHSAEWLVKVLATSGTTTDGLRSEAERERGT